MFFGEMTKLFGELEDVEPVGSRTARPIDSTQVIDSIKPQNARIDPSADLRHRIRLGLSNADWIIDRSRASSLRD